MPKISEAAGRSALAAWVDGGAQHDTTRRADLLCAVRYQLQRLAARHPGRAVEVRVPPAGAVQILTGTNHRRGTPPAVVEMDMQTWLELSTGRVSWAQAVAAGRVSASGERSDLSAVLPLP